MVTLPSGRLRQRLVADPRSWRATTIDGLGCSVRRATVTAARRLAETSGSVSLMNVKGHRDFHLGGQLGSISADT